MSRRRGIAILVLFLLSVLTGPVLAQTLPLPAGESEVQRRDGASSLYMNVCKDGDEIWADIQTDDWFTTFALKGIRVNPYNHPEAMSYKAAQVHLTDGLYAGYLKRTDTLMPKWVRGVAKTAPVPGEKSQKVKADFVKLVKCAKLTPTPSATHTATMPSATFVPGTVMPSSTATPTGTDTLVPTATATTTNTDVETDTATHTATVVASDTATATGTDIASATFTLTADTNTPTPSSTATSTGDLDVEVIPFEDGDNWYFYMDNLTHPFQAYMLTVHFGADTQGDRWYIHPDTGQKISMEQDCDLPWLGINYCHINYGSRVELSSSLMIGRGNNFRVVTDLWDTNNPEVPLGFGSGGGDPQSFARMMLHYNMDNPADSYAQFEFFPAEVLRYTGGFNCRYYTSDTNTEETFTVDGDNPIVIRPLAMTSRKYVEMQCSQLDNEGRWDNYSQRVMGFRTVVGPTIAHFSPQDPLYHVEKLITPYTRGSAHIRLTSPVTSCKYRFHAGQGTWYSLPITIEGGQQYIDPFYYQLSEYTPSEVDCDGHVVSFDMEEQYDLALPYHATLPVTP